MRLLRDWQRVVCPLLALTLPARAQSQAQTQGETASAAITTTTDTSITTPARLAPDATAKSTCEARTVNYITHTLPQQCLTATPSPAAPAHPSASGSGPGPGHGAAADHAAAGPEDPPREPPSQQPVAADDEHELDSDGNDLSTGAFMSFEEWKKKMLQKAGQEPLEARARKPHGEYPDGDLSSLGDEGEISLDFGAYSDRISDIASPGKPAPREQEKPDPAEKAHYDEGLANVYRSKDAGKTCKERFSYASFDAGATILKTSPGAKNTKAILVENKDSYMLLECASQNKFFIVELSEDIVVDTVVLANFEFFSSMIRHFRVSVSDRYPAKLEKWKVLGEFQARNSRDIQPFLIENPQIWARYLRIEILSHYGNEFYCPVSLLRVHGTRMLDSWKDHDPTDLELEEEESAKTLPEQPEEAELAPEVAEEVEVPEPGQDNATMSMDRVSLNPPHGDGTFFEHYFQTKPTCPSDDAPAASTSTPEATGVEAVDGPPGPQVTTEKSNGFVDSIRSLTSALKPSEETSTADAMAPTPNTPTPTPKASSPIPADNTTEATVTSSSSIPVDGGSQARTSSSSTKFTTPLSNKPSSSPPARSKPTSSAAAKPSSSKAPQPKQPAASSSSSRNRNATATTSSPSSSPTVQDSFFKQLTKRLQTLESNTTLSLQYIESQSKFLQEALSKLERRQVAKVDLFLDTLNKTVFSELRDLRVQYDQMWQSTVIALETHRDQSEREILAVSSRLGALADEVVFQKRMVIVQSILLLGCLLVLVFSGRLAGSGVELYYPSHILGASSRLGSPVYPSTPKATARSRPDQSPPSGLRESIEVDAGIDSSPPNPHLMPVSGDNRRMERSATPEPEPARAPQQTVDHPDKSAAASGPRPPSQRTVSEAGGMAYYQPPTPSSPDLGYDSEPPLAQNRDYFTRSKSQQRPSSSSSSSLGLDQYEELRPASSSSSQQQQHMEPFADGDDPGATTAEEAVSLSNTDGANGTTRLVEEEKAEGAAGIPDMASYRSARPPLSHAGSLRKEPLPALPEDDDRVEPV